MQSIFNKLDNTKKNKQNDSTTRIMFIKLLKWHSVCI